MADWECRELVILVDSGSTHNFISPTITRRAKLRVDYSSKVNVKIANGDLIRSDGTAIHSPQRYKVLLLPIVFIYTLGVVSWSYELNG